jgi:hypothetical protein
MFLPILNFPPTSGLLINILFSNTLHVLPSEWKTACLTAVMSIYGIQKCFWLHHSEHSFISCYYFTSQLIKLWNLHIYITLYIFFILGRCFPNTTQHLCPIYRVFLSYELYGFIVINSYRVFPDNYSESQLSGVQAFTFLSNQQKLRKFSFLYLFKPNLYVHLFSQMVAFPSANSNAVSLPYHKCHYSIGLNGKTSKQEIKQKSIVLCIGFL